MQTLIVCLILQTAFLEVVIPPDIVYGNFRVIFANSCHLSLSVFTSHPKTLTFTEETSGDMMVPEGSSAKLVCKARGFPKPKITWRREDGREIIARNGPHGKTKGHYHAFE